MVHNPPPDLAIAYLPDPEDLALTFEDWPPDVSLALYLEPEGRCVAVPFCPAERSRIAERLGQIFKRDTDQIGIFPPLTDHREVPLLYSDEQALLAMLRQGDPTKILGPVRDYALNYKYAEEEGIDPHKMVQSIRIPLSGDDTDKPGAVDASIKTPAEPAAPFMLPAPEAPPTGFVRLDPEDRDLCQRSSGVVFLDPEDRLILAPKGAAGTPVQLPGLDVFVRDDFKGLALTLPRDAARTNIWALPVARIPAAILPSVGRKTPVELSQIGRTLFVTFAAIAEPSAKSKGCEQRPQDHPKARKPRTPSQSKASTHRRRHDVTEIPPRLRYRLEQTRRRSRLRGIWTVVTLLVAVSGTVVLALG